MSRIKLNLLFVCLFFVYTQGMWERTLFFVPEVAYIVDAVVMAFILFQFKFSIKVPGSKIFLVFIGMAFFIGAVNSDSIVETFLYLRYVMYFCLIYNQLYVLSINVKDWVRILKFVVLLILIQGVGALYNIFIFGERREGYVGLMSSIGGTTATAFPLLISSITLLYFLFRPKMDKKLWLLFALTLASVFLVGYSSSKRGIFFIIPLFFAITVLISIPKLTKRGFLKRKLVGLSLIGMVIFPVLIFGMINSKGINYDLSGNESSIEIIFNSLNFAEEYESSTDEYGSTTGRSNTTAQIVGQSLSDGSLFLSGNGYGAVKEESTMLKLGYLYGIVGFTRDIVSGGWILMLLTMLLISTVILKHKSINLDVTTTFRKLVFLIFVYTHFYYSADYTVHLKITLVLGILLALFNSPIHGNAMCKILKNNQLIKRIP
jgi:hypothetical protein